MELINLFPSKIIFLHLQNQLKDLFSHKQHLPARSDQKNDALYFEIIDLPVAYVALC
jgi:hypothetical protein